MAFEFLKKKKAEDEETELPPELEHFKLPGPPFGKKEEPVEAAPQRRPFIPEEFAEERFGPRRKEPEEDRISIIIHKLDIIESRLKIIEEKLKK